MYLYDFRDVTDLYLYQLVFNRSNQAACVTNIDNIEAVHEVVKNPPDEIRVPDYRIYYFRTQFVCSDYRIRCG